MTTQHDDADEDAMAMAPLRQARSLGESKSATRLHWVYLYTPPLHCSPLCCASVLLHSTPSRISDRFFYMRMHMRQGASEHTFLMLEFTMFFQSTPPRQYHWCVKTLHPAASGGSGGGGGQMKRTDARICSLGDLHCPMVLHHLITSLHVIHTLYQLFMS